MQLRERRRNIGRRLEAVQRIQEAAGGLSERIGEIEAQEVTLRQLDVKLVDLTSPLLEMPELVDSSAVPALQTA